MKRSPNMSNTKKDLIRYHYEIKRVGDLDKMRTYNKGEIISNKSLTQKIKNYAHKY